jgi:RimJ/RimL family protein N-acetyltransferase
MKSDKKRIVDSDIVLIPYYPNEEIALKWYQDLDVCKQVDNIDHVYTMDNLKTMYGYLSTHGDCFYIEYRGVLVGDVTLRDNNEVCIVICKEYQNRHIGRRCIENMISLAREKGIPKIKANIYSFNEQSRKMFLSVGFIQTAEEMFALPLENNVKFL